MWHAESEAGHASDLVAAGVRLAEAVAALSARLKEAAAKEGHLTARAHAARTMQEQQQALQELAGTVPKPGVLR